MSHTIRNKPKLVGRVRRLKGQMEAIERALESEAPCGQVLQLLASVRGALGGLTAEVMEDQVREHVLAAESDIDRKRGGDELIEAIRTYIK
ncbi:metal/formaldehyde-sensitive transcriptional repressor [Bradyrhizobium sp. RDT10]